MRLRPKLAPMARFLDGVPAQWRNAVFALGNFDGFHKGHQAVVAAAMRLARLQGRPACVATFSPHPTAFFRPQATPFLLSTVEQRMEYFEDFGADGAIAIPFNAGLAGLSAEDFILEWLVERLGASAIVTGEDFCFGAGRHGTTATLKAVGGTHGITAITVPPLGLGGKTVSSTRIRGLLSAGEVESAECLLGRPFEMRSQVISGAVSGGIGGQCALDLGDYVRPLAGLYAAGLEGQDGLRGEGAIAFESAAGGRARIALSLTQGLRPSFSEGDRVTLQLHAYLRGEPRIDMFDAWARSDFDAEMCRHALQARRR